MNDQLWWDRWWAICTEFLSEGPVDLGSAVIERPDVGLVIWRDATDGGVRVILDTDWVANALAADAGLVISNTLRETLARWKRLGGVVQARPTEIPRSRRG